MPTHIRFNINMPVLTSKKQFKRSHVTTGETKKPKIQNLSEGPETFVFLVFLGFFWFSNRNPKNHMFFLDLGGNQKTQVFFLFSCSVSGEQPKNPVFFWISVGKPKKHHVFFFF